MNHKPTMYVFSPNMNEIHDWPRNGDLVETMKIQEAIPNTHVAVRPHRKTKYPTTKVAIVLKQNLQKV